MSDSDETSHLVLRCGGKNGSCGKPVFIPFSMMDSLDKLREQLKAVNWAVINHDIEGHPVADIACTACLMDYLAARLPPSAQAALDVDLPVAPEGVEAAALDNDVVDADLTPTGEEAEEPAAEA